MVKRVFVPLVAAALLAGVAADVAPTSVVARPSIQGSKVLKVPSKVLAQRGGQEKVTFTSVISKASARAFKGGLAGMVAGIIQVITFMWLRTTMNYQYRYGVGGMEALKALYAEGGIPRFYRGLKWACIQNPISRFGDTFANAGILALFAAFMPNAPIGLQTAFASAGGSAWRIVITPIDTIKTTMQVKGAEAMDLIWSRYNEAGGFPMGIGTLYTGAVANFGANWVGSFPWFFVFNYLQQKVPQKTGKAKLLRNAFIGIVASAVSDVISNGLRVTKVYMQTNEANVNIFQAMAAIVAESGIQSLLFRGLGTRMITNMLQSMVFSVLWKAIEEELNKSKESAA